jgi:hypothetical protein
MKQLSWLRPSVTCQSSCPLDDDKTCSATKTPRPGGVEASIDPSTDRGDNRRLKRGEKLADAYFDTSLPVLRDRLFRGGVRLAMVLNEIWPAD